MHLWHDAVLPFTWTPTKGNDIPPLAAPLRDGLYIARGLLAGEMHIGTTSRSSSGGARIWDRHGRAHDVLEYEVLTCASHLRFRLEHPPPVAPKPVLHTVRTNPVPRWNARRDVETTADALVPDSPPRSRASGRPAPSPWLSPPRTHLATISSEMQGNRSRSDPPPYTSPKDGWVEPPKRPQPIALSRRENVQFNHLIQSKCFTLIDDTPSMQYSWAQTRAALTGVIDVLSSDSKWEGLDVKFLHHAECRPCVKTAADFEHIFNSVALWRGEKVMTEKVSQVFAECLPLIHEACPPKPVALLIITDNIAIDTHEFFDAMVYICQKLNRKCIPPHMFRVHLLQMGDDRKAVRPLHDFRDRLIQLDRERRILDVVSFHRGRGPLNAQGIFKHLLASAHVPIEQDPDVGERQPPEVIEAQYQELERIRIMGMA